MNELFSQVFSYIIGPLIMGFAGWFFSKKKYSTEVKSNVIENVASAIKIWENLAHQHLAELKKTQVDLEEAKNEILQLKERLLKFENER